MAKLKMARKSTFVDMTAMCDVAFLLLTFFILATKIKPPEAVEVRTPASTSTTQIPDNFMLMSLSKDGRVYFNIENLNAREALINYLNENKGLGLTAKEIQNFKEANSIGVPFNQLKSYLDLSVADRTKFDKKAPGIPVDTTGNFETNELAYWIRATRMLNPDYLIAIKADGAAAYPYVKKIIGTLGHQKIYRFNFITESKGIPPGSPLAQERAEKIKKGIVE
ncbi:MAG TPA: biopolymer transporter ExbD [Edaphocola sp.]|nr:biopolymer transporter ExbD [Edaphocola sp.]